MAKRSRINFSMDFKKFMKGVSIDKVEASLRKELTSVLSDLSVALITNSPSKQAGSPYSKNRYVYNTRVYFSNSRSGTNAAPKAPYSKKGSTSLPAEIGGLSDAITALASKELPKRIVIVNDVTKPSHNYPYFWNVEESGWYSKSSGISRPPYNVFRKSWASVAAKHPMLITGKPVIEDNGEAG